MAFIEVTYKKEVVHIGFLDTPEARKPSLDGPGISVTTKPESWRRMKGMNGPEFTLIFPAAQWVDAMTFSDQDMSGMRAWAKSRGYIDDVEAWQTMIDDGIDFVTSSFLTLEEAATAAGRTVQEEEDATPGQGACWREDVNMITRRGMKKLDRWPGAFTQVEQAIMVLYIREVVVPTRPYIVGVWWSEPDRPDMNCAPSGILFPERLHHFEVEDGDGEVFAFSEKFPNFLIPPDPLVTMD